jgi:DNA polymerase
MNNEISIDFETFSECDLTKSGSWKYARHPSTEILSLSYSINNNEPVTFRCDDVSTTPEELFELIKQGAFLRAWNANFEKAIWEEVAVKKLKWIAVSDDKWIDDMAIAATYAYPLQLKRCGDALGLPQEHLKSNKGTLLINKFSKLNQSRKKADNKKLIRVLPEDDLNAFEDFLDYNRQDVVAQQSIVNALPKQHMTEYEQDAWVLDSNINKRGILIDIKMAEGAVALLKMHEEKLLSELSKITDNKVTSVKQVAKFREWLSIEGCDLPNLQKETISNYLSQEDLTCTDKAIKALKLRQELGLASVSKYKAMINCACNDNRVRGALQFKGATRTGRFAGRLIQIQNFPRGKHLSEETIEKIQNADYDALNSSDESLTKLISNGLRQALIAPSGKILGVADYAGIENRVLAWLANDKKSLRGFENGEDQYKVMAASLFNVKYEEVNKAQRTIGKVIILGCGYSMGTEKFHHHANDIFKLNLTEREAEIYVSKYRETYDSNVKLWRELDNAAKNALKTPGMAFSVGTPPNGKVIFKKINSNLYCHLPSKRNLCYPQAKIDDSGKWEQIVFKSEVLKKWVIDRTYGGKLCENICQAVSRDLLVDALKNLESKNYKTVAHIHDEIICEFDESHSLEEMIDIMTQKPAWAKTLPLKAEGFTSKRYKK